MDLTLVLLRLVGLLIVDDYYLCLFGVVRRRVTSISRVVGINVGQFSININYLSIFPTVSITMNVEMTLCTRCRIYLRV